jgi:signal peptidase
MDIDMETTPLADVRPEAAAAPHSRLARARRLTSWLLTAVATAVVAGLLAVTIGPKLFPYQALVVRSGSMSPTIPTGSLVFYRSRPAAKVRIGDVIVFTRPGQAGERVTHRVYEVGTSPSGRYFVTKGDANAVPDDWQVPAVGTGWVAAFHVPYVGYAIAGLESSLGRLLLLLVPATLLGAITLYEIWRDRPGGASA